jgi:RNA polymerase sigma-54 factor
MRRLVVNPGGQLVEEASPVIVPDAIVEYDDDADRYYAYLTDGRLPNLRLNREYARMSKDRSMAKSDRDFIKTNLSNAQWLMDAVEQRRQTLLRVINAVVSAQRDFFDLGPESLKPLPMTQVAEQLGIHVATVSRAVAGKHIQTPRGVFALRKFFTGGTQTEGVEGQGHRDRAADGCEVPRAARHPVGADAQAVLKRAGCRCGMAGRRGRRA